MSQKETKQFNAEIQQLLNIVVHSLYSQKEIFLRELISNASDALDKLKFQGLTNSNLIPAGHEFVIRLNPNAKDRTLQIIDSGIGMSKDEVTEFIGTIAKSGTKAFSQLSKNADLKNHPELIGQFGVGFYSAFMVAERVILHTQKAGTTEGTVWESTGDGSYSIDSVPRAEGTGTTITLVLKKTDDNKDVDADKDATSLNDYTSSQTQDFSDEWELKSLVKKYSDFVSWPIKMKTETTKTTDGKEEKVIEDQTLNSQKALWLKPSQDLTAEEYKEFYKHISHDYQDPARWIHYKAEGATEFTSLVYIPTKRPWNYFMKDYESGLSLYIKRVFIMNHSKDLLPPYLRFVKGLVDSSDLSLNVSREMLQQDRLVSQIKKNVTGKILNSLKDWLGKERGEYEKFWAEFGTTIKEGIPTDTAQLDKLQDLLLFRSTQSDNLTTFAEYVDRMKPTQKDIYYIAGERLEAVQNSAYLERLKEKGFEVLFLVDAVDEWVTQSVTKYKDKNLVSVVKEGLDLDSAEEKSQKEVVKKAQQERFAGLIEKMKTKLQNQVKDVVLSDRLTSTPVCLVTGQNDMTSNMKKILAQMGDGAANMGMMGEQKQTLEINPGHKVFESMLTATDDQIATWSEILYNQALLNEGNSLPNPARFSQLIADLITNQRQ
jgi:molecular chaperone HtpG